MCGILWEKRTVPNGDVPSYLHQLAHDCSRCNLRHLVSSNTSCVWLPTIQLLSHRPTQECATETICQHRHRHTKHRLRRGHGHTRTQHSAHSTQHEYNRPNYEPQRLRWECLKVSEYVQRWECLQTYEPVNSQVSLITSITDSCHLRTERAVCKARWSCTVCTVSCAQ